MAATVPTEHKPSLLYAHIYTQYTYAQTCFIMRLL